MHLPYGMGSPYAQQPFVPATATGRSMSRHALIVTIIAIAIGGLLQLVFVVLSSGHHYSIEAMVRFELVLIISFYAGVLVLLERQGRLRNLHWHRGSPLRSGALGLLAGGGLATVLTMLNSAANGHLTTDGNILLLVSEGDLAHFVAAVVISMIAAPIVEEILFRGSLAQSFLDEGNAAAALWVPAIAFAVWHFNPSALRYYVVMGLLAFVLYKRGGLLRSMAAHFAFNGTLTVLAIYLTVQAGPLLHIGPVSIATPAGWRITTTGKATLNATSHAAVTGPSAARLDVVLETLPRAVTVEQLQERLGNPSEAFGGKAVTVDAVQRTVVGGCQSLLLAAHGEEGGDTMYVVPAGTQLYVFELVDRGSAKARGDFQHMLSTVRICR